MAAVSEITTEHPPAGTTVYYCPLGDWTHTQLPPTELELMQAATQPAVTYIRRRLQDVEAEVEAHLNAHGLIDWLTEINRLRAELEAQQAIATTAATEKAFAERDALLVTSILVRQLGGTAEITTAEMVAASGVLVRVPSLDGGMTLTAKD